MRFQPDRSIGRGVLQLRIEPWRFEAACREIEPEVAKRVFFPEAGDKGKPYLQWCNRCPVKTQCLNEGLAQQGKHHVGIYGGLNQRQLGILRAKRSGKFHGNVKKEIAHGTFEGYRQHRVRHIALCDACREVAKDQRYIERIKRAS